jgi:hypothetical protein
MFYKTAKKVRPLSPSLCDLRIQHPDRSLFVYIAKLVLCRDVASFMEASLSASKAKEGV